MSPVDYPIRAAICLGLLFVATIVTIEVVSYFARKRFLRWIVSVDPKRESEA